MRPWEFVLLCLTLLPVFWMLAGLSRWPVWLRLVAVGSGGALAVHGLVEGLHWQLIPLYLAVLILVWIGVRSSGKPLRLVGLLELGLLLAAVGLALALPMFHFPKPTGSYAVGTRTAFLIDPARMETHPGARQGHREVVYQVWYPAATNKGTHAVYRRWKETDLRSTYQAVLRVDSLQDAPVAEGRFPVVLFNHAWRGFRNRSTFLMQELASHGFIVVSVAHPWNASTVELHDGYVADGRPQIDLGNFYIEPPLTLQQRLELAERELTIQSADDRFVLDELERLDRDAASAYAGRIDVKHSGSIGHSFGGSTAAELAFEDPRVLSVVGLDSALYGRVAREGLDKPILTIESDADFVNPPLSVDSPDLITRTIAQMGALDQQSFNRTYLRYGGYLAVITGIDHENFTDKGFFSPFRSLSGIGILPQTRAAAIIDQLCVAFFTETLKGQPQPLLHGHAESMPEVRIQVYPRQAPKAVTGDVVP